jgi:hypothetical protein
MRGYPKLTWVGESEMCAHHYFMPTSVGNGASWKIVVRDVTGVVSVNFARRGSSMHSHFYLQGAQCFLSGVPRVYQN